MEEREKGKSIDFNLVNIDFVRIYPLSFATWRPSCFDPKSNLGI